MCEISFDEACDVWREKKVRARKSHTCSSCDAEIKRGDSYVTHFSVYDGYTNSEKCCMLCEESRTVFEEEHDVCIAPSYLTEMLSHCVEDTDTKDPQRWQAMLDAIEQRKPPQIPSGG